MVDVRNKEVQLHKQFSLFLFIFCQLHVFRILHPISLQNFIQQLLNIFVDSSASQNNLKNNLNPRL